MIPEYKLYHGAVLTEIIHRHPGEVTIRDLDEEGRPSSYIVNGRVAVQIKHATQRLRPWAFGLTKANVDDLYALSTLAPSVFLALVCHTDGIACISLDEIPHAVPKGASDQTFVRVDRKKGEWYRVVIGGQELPAKKSNGVDAIVQAIALQAALRYA